MKEYLRDKRDELVWALADQGFNGEDIKTIFSSVGHRSTALRIISRKPKDYKPKWVKLSDTFYDPNSK